jgi:hypothetical protein
MSEQPTSPRPDLLVARKLPAFALWEQLQRRAQPLGMEFCSVFFAGDMSYKQAQKWLEGYGIKASVNALQGFFHSMDMRLRYASLQSAQIAETAKTELPADIEQATKDRIAQHKFELSMLNLSEQHKLQLIQIEQNEEGMKGNFALKKAALDLRQKAEDRLVKKAKLEREKFEFDAAKAALARAAELKSISASKLTDVEKIDAARRALFGALPEDAPAANQEKFA